MLIMATQQTQVLKRMYIPNVRTPVISEVQLLGKSRIDAAQYAQDQTNGVILIDDSRTINTIAFLLRDSRKDGYVPILKDPRNKNLDAQAVAEAAKKLDQDLWQ